MPQVEMDQFNRLNKKEIFVARQPIFEVNQKVFGYELLFRTGLDNYFDQNYDIDFASSKTIIDSFLLFGIKELARGKRAFINFSQKVLESEIISALPKNLIVIELLETIIPDSGIVEACRKLKEMGYVLALDDFVFKPEFSPLLTYTDIIKIDFRATNQSQRKHIVKTINSKRIRFLAEKVETLDEFNNAVSDGFTLFQGYFFSKPVIISGKDIPSYKPNLLLLFRELLAPRVSLDKIEELMKRDISLSYKLLRFINSAAFGFYNEIKSIKYAINLIGLVEFKKWMSMIILSQIGNDKPDELLQESIIRARFCELLAEKINMKARKADFFFMGMFSMIDTLMGMEMSEILSRLPLTEDVSNALLGKKNILRSILDLVLKYEKGDWDYVSSAIKELNLKEEEIPVLFLESINWAYCFNQ